jgi:hypothetical protein
MTTSILTTNIVGDLEIKNSPALAFEMQPIVAGPSETLIDEFDATVYQGCRLTLLIKNEIGQIEINECMVIHDDVYAYVRNLGTLNNISSNTYISQFRAELLRGFVRVFITGVGNKNEIRFFRLMFKK